jgi:hypothetical protein
VRRTLFFMLGLALIFRIDLSLAATDDADACMNGPPRRRDRRVHANYFGGGIINRRTRHGL